MLTMSPPPPQVRMLSSGYSAHMGVYDNKGTLMGCCSLNLKGKYYLRIILNVPQTQTP